MVVNELCPAKGSCEDSALAREALEVELIQTAAVCVVWLECLERKKDNDIKN